MTRKVSVSKTGQNQPKPTREERDAAYSHEGGRRAVEETIEQLIEEGKQNDSDEETISEPIGLKMETAGDEASN